MDITTIAIVGILFGGPMLTASFVAWLWHRRSAQAMQIRAMEARARLIEAQNTASLRTPGWVDPADPASVIAWQRAKLEVEGRLSRALPGPRSLPPGSPAPAALPDASPAPAPAAPTASLPPDPADAPAAPSADAYEDIPREDTLQEVPRVGRPTRH